jgi:hypothetical protein
MSEWRENLPQLRKPGCLATLAAMAILPVIAPVAAIVHRWRAWRRGSDVRVSINVSPGRRPGYSRVDATFDRPRAVQPGFRRRLTDVVVRAAEVLRQSDDVYNLVSRHPTDTEPLALPVGPQLQALGERFFLVLNQGSLAERTVVWLTLKRGESLAQVVDTTTYDPESAGEPEGLMQHESIRWSMATEWANVGPSLVVRMIVSVPTERAQLIQSLLAGTFSSP